MGTISSSTGIISGINYKDLIDKLMEIEARPLTQLKQRITDTTQQKTAFSTISAQLLAAKAAISRLAKASSFLVKKAASSNENVLKATAANNTSLNSYSFLVKSLVTTHQLISGGFADRATTPVGAGTMTFKLGEGYVDRSTPLSALNGLSGVRRGVIRITDRSGASADIDLRTVTRLDEVLQAINAETSINVQGRVSGDRIIIEDQTGLGSGSLSVLDINGGHAAEDLGIAATSATGVITGRDLVCLTNSTALSQLNDGIGLRFDSRKHDIKFTLSDGSEFNVDIGSGMRFRTAAKDDPPTPAISSTYLAELNDGRGVRRGSGGELKIRITNRNGDAGTIDLSGAQTLDDVKNLINTAKADDGVTDLKVRITAITGSAIIITDDSGGTASNLKIADVNGSGYAATDLGIAVDVKQNSYMGKSIYRMDTLGAVMRAIQYAEDANGNANNGRLQVSISSNGNGLLLTDTTGGSGTPTATALNGSQALRDLGLEGGFTGNTLSSRNLLAGLNTVLLASLNGGRGIDTGTLQFSLHNNETVQVDFSGAQTLQDVLEQINATGQMSAAVDAGGLGIVINDLTTGAGTFEILDDSGGEPPQMAVDLGLALDSKGQLASGDLHLQYISENTRLSALNSGKGVNYGKFTITNSQGDVKSVTLSSALHKTVGDVIQAINDMGMQVTARINAQGDGIELVDEAGGSGTLTVTDLNSGTAAANLRIAGSATAGVLTGSYTRIVEIDGDDTLNEVVKKINAADVGAAASVINDGSGYASYHLILNSNTTGSAGRIAYYTAGGGLNLNTLTDGHDATLVIGDPDSASAVIVNSSSNTVTDVVDGLTLNLLSTSNDPVTVSVSTDIDNVVSDLKTFIKAFNGAIDQIDKLTKYNADTQERGVLLGDNTASLIRNQLFRVVISNVDQQGLSVKRLSAVGITVSNNTLSLDEDKFRRVYAGDPQAVADLFTLTKTEKDASGKDKITRLGIAARLDDLIGQFTTSANGTISRKNDALQDRLDLYNKRATSLQEMLDKKESRLYAQYQALEKNLAALQSQQNSLSSLTSLISSM